MLHRARLAFFAAALSPLLAARTDAQAFDNRWIEFIESPGSLHGLATDVTDANNECDFAFGDVNQDGWTDLVVVRKQPFTTPGKRRNFLFLNESGVLVNRTSFVVASDVPGDNGFLTPTNDKNVKLADLTGDGWLDIVTSPTLGDGEPKDISHPRIYVNKGEVGGVWQGFEYQSARIPALLTPQGNPATPRFSDVSAGDVDGDGDQDLYFVDHDDGVGGYHQPNGTDADDHLLINDGNGYFTDETYSRVPSLMYTTNFGTDVVIADLNQDGFQDIARTSTNGPNEVAASYNDPLNEGVFNIYHDFHHSAPYSMAVGDLNRDGRLDVVAGDDAADRFVYNTGNDPLGRVIWSPSQTFAFLSGSENEFAGDPYIVDLDGDGWNDVILCDEDTDVPAGGTSHRTHVYHNPGGAIGSTTIRPLEERQSASSGAGQWVGAVGFDSINLRRTWDAAVFDLDNDGDVDVIFGQASGTHVWLNQTVPNTLQFDAAVLSLASGGTQNLLARAGAPHANELFWFLGSASGTAPGLPGPPPLPLNFDSYFQFTLTSPNTLIQNQIGFLDGDGNAQATLTLPPGLDPSLAGATLHHAYVAIETVTFHTTLVSNPVPSKLFP